MKNRIELYPASLLVLFTLLLSFPQTLFSQEEKLAVVSKYEGDVKVEHKSILKTVKKIGNRIRNSAVYEEDSVITMHRSTADLVFNDNTHLEIEEDTSISISTRETSEEENAEGGFIKQVSGGQSGIVRNINVKAGKFLANITPSKSVLTNFETPTGVASVRGTMFVFAYIAGVTSVNLFEGLIEFASAGNEVKFDISPGTKLNISMPAEGKVSVGVESGEVSVETNIGIANIEAGASIRVEIDTKTGGVALVAERGKVTLEFEDGTVTIEEGGSLKATIDAETGEVIVADIEGVVAITTEGGTAKVEVGMSLGIQETAAIETAYGAPVMVNWKAGEGVYADVDGPTFVAERLPFNKLPPDNQIQGPRDSWNQTQPATSTPTPTLPEVFRDDYSSGGFLDPQGAGSEAIINGSDDWNITTNAEVVSGLGSSIIAKSGDTSDMFAVIHTGGKHASSQVGDFGELAKEFEFAESGYRRPARSHWVRENRGKKIVGAH